MIERESEAWRAVAQYILKRRAHTQFLCLVLQFNYVAVPDDMRQRMITRIRKDLGTEDCAYDTDADEDMTSAERLWGRVLACLMFAEEAESEGR